VKAVFYDWLGANEWLFQGINFFYAPGIQDIWRLLAWLYGWWVAPLIALAICFHYLRVRHQAGAGQLAAMSRIMALLILAFCMIWCALYTAQTVSLWPRPWMVYADVAAISGPLPWHEGFPASAPAMAVMVAGIFWRYANSRVRRGLAAYVALGSVLAMVAGQSWPADIVYGLLTGAAAVWLAQRYYGFAVRQVSS